MEVEVVTFTRAAAARRSRRIKDTRGHKAKHVTCERVGAEVKTIDPRCTAPVDGRGPRMDGA